MSKVLTALAVVLVATAAGLAILATGIAGISLPPATTSVTSNYQNGGSSFSASYSSNNQYSATNGNLTLATISYKVIGNYQNGGNYQYGSNYQDGGPSFLASNGSVVVITASHLNLGNLTANQKGYATGTAAILVNSSGYFKIKLNDNVLHIDEVFSHFMVKLTIGNQTVTLAEGKHGNGHSEAIVYLNKGQYNVTITVYYVVSPHPYNMTVNNAPLLTIKPYYGHNHDDQEEYNS